MSLTRIQSLCVAAVLSDCCNQLNKLSSELSAYMRQEKYSTAEAQEKARVMKLKSDCEYISQQMSNLHAQLIEEQDFSCLLQEVEETDQAKNTENAKREAKRELASKTQTLHRQQLELREKTQNLKEMCKCAKRLSKQVDIQALKIEKRKKLEEKLQEQQLKRTQFETTKAESDLEKKRELLKDQLQQQAEVHEAKKKYLHYRHEELQQLQLDWQQRTDMMLHDVEHQLNEVNCKRAITLDKLAELKRTFREMEEVVLEDRKEQEKLRRQQEENMAATKIQAWWRGVMSRRGLGKKADKKKGKKKGEGKKKKK
ncbi:dynein regulatory complex protein 9-like [Neosynchiropus ocellatus]